MDRYGKIMEVLISIGWKSCPMNFKELSKNILGIEATSSQGIQKSKIGWR